MNVDAREGKLHVEILDEMGKPISGYTLEDSRAQTDANSVRFEPTWENPANFVNNIPL